MTMGNLKGFCNLIVSLNFTPLFVSIKILKLHLIYSKSGIVLTVLSLDLDGWWRAGLLALPLPDTSQLIKWTAVK